VKPHVNATAAERLLLSLSLSIPLTGFYQLEHRLVSSANKSRVLFWDQPKQSQSQKIQMEACVIPSFWVDDVYLPTF
jgi:hypothetical protein